MTKIQTFLIMMLMLTACTLPDQGEPLSDKSLSTSDPELQFEGNWQHYQSPELPFAIDYPEGWHVHSNMSKSLEISPNEQPSGSSISEADFTWPLIHIMHNLNRQMGATPMEEVEFLLSGYEGEIEAINQAAPLPKRPDTVMGIYRLEIEEDVSAIFLGAVENKGNDAVQSVISMSALVNMEEVDEFRPIFEHMLRSMQSE